MRKESDRVSVVSGFLKEKGYKMFEAWNITFLLVSGKICQIYNSDFRSLPVLLRKYTELHGVTGLQYFSAR